MFLKKLLNVEIWKDSFQLAIGGIAAIETIFAVCDLGVKDFIVFHWYGKLGIIAGVFIFTWFVAAICLLFKNYESITLKINNTHINIKKGDLFESDDWKVIACNEFFDTKVDDVIIAHNTVNGIFIDNYVKDISELQKVIKNAPKVQGLSTKLINGKISHPLGRIITFEDNYMLLAFTHFDNQNKARLTQNQYESCLRTMWKEIDRTYALRPISFTLLGAGITRFDNPKMKLETQLLKCLLCTLQTSNVTINQPITIYLTEKTLKNVDLYNIKKQFS